MTYIGHSRVLQHSYDTTEGTREYHRVYDFDLSYSMLGVDFISFGGVFLAMQHARTRFVSAMLLQRQRDCVAIITQCPIVVTGERGRFYMQLQFAAAAEQGLRLAIGHNETLTVRVTVAEDPGANFYLFVESASLPVDYVLHHRAHQLIENVHWAGADRPTTLTYVAGRMLTPSLFPWEPRMYGPPFLPLSSKKQR